MSTRTRVVLLVLALVGLWSAATSLYVHVQLLNQPDYKSFCDVNTNVSCTQVYQSAYATVAGVPVALFGLLWYGAVLVLLAGSWWGWASLQRNAATYIALWGIPGLASVAYFAYVAAVLLKTLCPMCAVTYGAVTGIFIVAWIATTEKPARVFSMLAEDWKTAVANGGAMAVVMVFIIGSTAAIAFVPRHGDAKPAKSGKGEMKTDFVKFWESQARVDVPIATDGASVVVIKFSDFMCPGCAQSYMEHRELLAKYAAKYPGDFKFILRDYPLEQECNPTVPVNKHEAACEAAVAARLARSRGRGEAMEEWLFTRNQSLTADMVRQGARDVGGVTDFDAQYPSVIDQIKRDIATAAAVGIPATPTFFIGHKAPGESTVKYVRAEGALIPEYFEKMIQYELKKAGKLADDK